MSKVVFISGSRSISSLSSEAKQSLSIIMSKGMSVVVGDCYGVDIAVQTYLKSKSYAKVTVYHVGKKVRNNAGYPTCYVASPHQIAKNVAMAQVADSCLAVWDGFSRGTADAIRRMKAKGCYVRVVQQVSEATTRFCRVGTHPRKQDRPEEKPLPNHETCNKCLQPKSADELKGWNGQLPCPPYCVVCQLTRRLTH